MKFSNFYRLAALIAALITIGATIAIRAASVAEGQPSLMPGSDESDFQASRRHCRFLHSTDMAKVDTTRRCIVRSGSSGATARRVAVQTE